MTSKKFEKQTKRFVANSTRASVTSSKQWRFRWWWPVIVLGIAMAGLIISQVMANRDAGISDRQAVVKRNAGVSDQGVNVNGVPVNYGSGDTAWDPSWPPLPQSGEPARPIEVVRAMYAYAARRGEVLQYMPCYCGCERQGHGSNRDCFVKGKTGAGLPKWDPMGYT